MVWSETRLVGCGFVYFRENKRGFTKMYVCNYGPQGNLVGGTMYKTRKRAEEELPCDKTLDFSESPVYPGLCRKN